MKTRREALAEMESPSRLFLSRLASDENAPAKLRLDASRRLPQAEHRMAGQRAVRERQRAEPDEESRRREIDLILGEAAEELGINLDEQGGSKVIPESAEQDAGGAPPAPPCVPDYEVSSDAGSHPQSGQAVDLPDVSSNCEELLAEGRALTTAIHAQLGIMAQAPLNWHAGQKKLEQLQAEFSAFERAMNIDHPEIDTLQLFPDESLRYFPKVTDQHGYFAQRRVATIDEQRFIQPPERVKAARADSGIWSGAGPGI